MTAALVIVLTCVLVYAVLAGCAPVLAGSLGWVYALLIIAACAVIEWKAGRR